ncbi:MAG: DNA-binding response regulator [Cytophagales bacterium]|nr:MAG: DNA-binding response regulator [Cytophagales bacterium]
MNTPLPQPPRVLIADDHPLFNDSLSVLITSELGWSIVGQVYEGNRVVPMVHQTSPNLVLLDLNLPQQSGLQIAEELLRDYASVAIVFMTMYAEGRVVEEAQRLGVQGYLLKTTTRQDILTGLRAVANGQRYFDPGLTPTTATADRPVPVSDDFARRLQLTPRELSIIRYIQQGLGTDSIAEKMHLSPLTIKTHRRNIHFKIGTSSTAELLRFAAEQNI